MDLSRHEVWLFTGSQHLYGQEALAQVGRNAQEVAGALDSSPAIPVRIAFKPVLTSPDEIYGACLAANADPNCVGVIAWMHTFSPAKMWIRGLKALYRPILHLHTQANRELPWAEIDMDFMNLNQAAHGDREFGHILTRLCVRRKTVVGHWSNTAVQDEIGTWSRAACAWSDLQGMQIARFGDNMRQVAVTEGDKVEAEIRLGIRVDGFGVGDLAAEIDQIGDKAIERLIEDCVAQYEFAEELLPGGSKHDSLREALRIEAGLRAFLEDRGCKAFTTTFEDLHGLEQLPGISVQRLMADGFGFGAEGDWKTAALVRAMKVMGQGLHGATSFMEDYTYHLVADDPLVLGAHMLEICPSIAKGKPRVEVHPLSIGGKPDPVRLVFDSVTGPAINASLVDAGNRFRLVVNEVEAIEAPSAMPKLPVARAVWRAKPDLATSAACWMEAGGAHHTGFSTAVTARHLVDLAEIAGLECAVIDTDTTVGAFKDRLRWNGAHYGHV